MSDAFPRSAPSPLTACPLPASTFPREPRLHRLSSPHSAFPSVPGNPEWASVSPSVKMRTCPPLLRGVLKISQPLGLSWTGSRSWSRSQTAEEGPACPRRGRDAVSPLFLRAGPSWLTASARCPPKCCVSAASPAPPRLIPPSPTQPSSTQHDRISHLGDLCPQGRPLAHR